VDPANPGEVEEKKVRPGESLLVITPREKGEKPRGEISMSGNALVRLVTEGVKSGKPALTPDEVSKYIDAKLEAEMEKVKGALREEIKETRTAEKDIARELGDKIDKMKPGNPLDTFLNFLDKLEKRGFISVKGREEGEGEISAKDWLRYKIAKDKLILEKEKFNAEQEYKKAKLGLMRRFARDIGEAIAEAGEEVSSSEKATAVSKPKGKGKEEVETIKCKYGATIAIPPEKQSPGEEIKCPRCGSIYEYVEEEG